MDITKKHKWLNALAMGLSAVLGKEVVTEMDSASIGAVFAAGIVMLFCAAGWGLSVYLVNKIERSELGSKKKNTIFRLLPILYFAFYFACFLLAALISGYQSIHWGNVLILLALVVISISLAVKYKIWTYLQKLTHRQRLIATSVVGWLAYVVIRTSGRFEFLGIILPAWHEQSLPGNLFLPPLLICTLIYAWRWIKKGTSD